MVMLMSEIELDILRDTMDKDLEFLQMNIQDSRGGKPLSGSGFNSYRRCLSDKV